MVSARIEADDRASYYPGARKIWVKLIVERESRKLVGAQAVGYGDVSKRIDVAATALDEPMAGLSVKESLDLARHLKLLAERRQVSVLLVEHDIGVVFGISDVIIVFVLGHFIAQGGPAAVRANPRVREAYLGSAA